MKDIIKEDQEASRPRSNDGAARQAPNDLLARVEAANGPDRALDVLIHTWLTGEPDPWEKCLYWRDNWLEPELVAPVTASLDAALALVERTKDGGIDAAQMLHEALENMANGGWRDDRPIGPQICLYLLAAMLRALTPSPATACSGDADTGEGRG